jgi:hypothetical protein
MIAKPVGGGDYCYSLAEALGKTELRGGVAASPGDCAEAPGAAGSAHLRDRRR